MGILLRIGQIVLSAMILITTQAKSQLLISSLEPWDETLVPGSAGVKVVDATLLKLHSITKFGVELQNDFGFLKRIALVESNFGNANLQHRNGGIWQISPHILNSLSNIPASVQRLVDAFGQAFGNDAINFTKNDFSVPLHSAVAARVFIELEISTSFTVFPGTYIEQGLFWNALYTNKTESSFDFIKTVKDYELANQCNVRKLDLWFLIDGSGSTGLNNFKTYLKFVNETASVFTIAPDRVRTGLMIYSDSHNVASFFNQHQSNEEFSRAVFSTLYTGGGTLTGSAINHTVLAGFNAANGARPLEDGVPRAMVVLTDGWSRDSVVEASKYIKSEGVTVFGVGGFNEEEVNEIASNPDSTYAFAYSGFLTFSTLLKDTLINKVCFAPAVLPKGNVISFVYQPGSISYSQVDLPDGDFLEMTFNVKATTSFCIVYVSVSVANPGPALYDAKFKISAGATVIYYNVDEILSATQKRKKRQTDSGNRPSTLFLGIETNGTEPVSLDFTATERADAFDTTTMLTTSGAGAITENGEISLTLLNILMLFWTYFIN